MTGATGQAETTGAGATRRSDCDPRTCPCLDGVCTLSRYARSSAHARGEGQPSLVHTERAVAQRLEGLDVDMESMAAVSNIYRAANGVRNHLERTVLAPHDLTWTSWVVLWVVWIWGELEARHVAEEAGIAKPTLSGVLHTLEGRGLVRRKQHPDDARRVLVSLTRRGSALMVDLFPRFNEEEARVMGALTRDETTTLARSLRAVVATVEHP